MIRDAVTCDRPNCLGRYLEPDDYPENAFEDHVWVLGWELDDRTGHHCPACRAGRGPVIELGECPKCGGSTGNTATGDRCHYCRYEIPYTDDDLPEDPVDEDQAAADAPACAKCRTPFDPDDTRHDGHARYSLTDYCRRCIDQCHEGSAEHVCVICDPDRYRV